mgnify:CR=1 FL=1
MFKRFFLLVCLLATPVVHAQPVVLVLGDSLSAAYGIPLEQGWVALLEQRLSDEGLPHRVVNASVSGETTAGGLARLPQLLDRHQPEWVLIELGGNDGLRGQPPRKLDENLTAMVAQVRAAGGEAILFEMMIPANYGPAYTSAFTKTFSTVAERLDAPLVPFMLAPIAEDESQFLDDGIHPNADAQPLLLDAVWPTLAPLLGASKNNGGRN